MSDVKYDPALCERLIEKHRATSPLVSSGWTQQMYNALAEQLEAARAEVERLTARIALESAALEQSCAVDIHSPITVAEAIDRAIAAYRGGRNKLQAELESARRETKTAWEQADILADGLEQACAALVSDRGADALRSKLRKLYRDAYRAARDGEK